MILDLYKTQIINKSTLFLTPLVSYLLEFSPKDKKSFFHFLSRHGFRGAYLEDVECEGVYPHHLTLVFNKEVITNNNSTIQCFDRKDRNLIDYFLYKKLCVDYYERDDNLFIVIDFKDLKEDYLKIVKGQYSSISRKLVFYFKEIAERDYICQYIYSVVIKNPKLKDLLEKNFESTFSTDYHSVFNLDTEVYRNVEDLDYKSVNNFFKKLCNQING